MLEDPPTYKEVMAHDKAQARNGEKERKSDRCYSWIWFTSPTRLLPALIIICGGIWTASGEWADQKSRTSVNSADITNIQITIEKHGKQLDRIEKAITEIVQALPKNKSTWEGFDDPKLR